MKNKTKGKNINTVDCGERYLLVKEIKLNLFNTFGGFYKRYCRFNYGMIHIKGEFRVAIQQKITKIY